MPNHGTRHDDELELLLAQSSTEADERREQERQRAIEFERERRLEDVFNRLNVDPGDFHDETLRDGGFPEWYEATFPPPPPPAYWLWYAERLIGVAHQIMADGWEDDLAELEADDRPGKIALGLLRQAATSNVDTTAKNLELAVLHGKDGQEVKAWLAIRICEMLRGVRPRRATEEPPTEAAADAPLALDEAADSSNAAPLPEWAWDIPRKQGALVRYLWGRRKKTASFDDLHNDVWGDSPVQDDAIDRAVTRANERLVNHGYTLSISNRRVQLKTIR